MPRAGGAPRWFEAEPTFVLHFVNAYDDGDEVILDGFRQEHPIPSLDLETGAIDRWRWPEGTYGSEAPVTGAYVVSFVSDEHDGECQVFRADHLTDCAAARTRAGRPWGSIAAPFGRL